MEKQQNLVAIDRNYRLA